ncbi:TlpA disulfide reductase family protein [Sphingobacterium sp. UT-1RO-CII-1]|uniref:TlpA family protein disulfide reductase n=1 Tax=Sphingobacterium sp. UT-1RO-CII-1 TaxID=2995225 RepID=UPI00227D43FF|nr:TlpA disulfide reductase family protein [Sphingobacterium sp. UT-1RO-CII-1]MCY4780511.1 TlpA disulfide reductase family protein [Sphingobacterium sp. UT-1RO-CII-1]
MMRFLRKGDCYALEKPIKKRYYLSLNSFQCLLLPLGTIYYQFSCNVQLSRARGTTGEGEKSKKQAVMKPSWSMASVMSFNTLLIHCYYFTHTWRILRPYTKTASARVAGWFGMASRLGRTLVHICSTGVRLLFECCSSAVRVRVEAQSKASRRAPEGLSNKCRSRVEAQSKDCRRALEGLPNNSRSRVEELANRPPRFTCNDGKIVNDLYMNQLVLRWFESFCGVVRGKVGSMLVKDKRSSQNGLNESGGFLLDKERADDIKRPMVYGLQLIAIFCVLFNFASTMEVKAQELRPGGATGIGEIKPLEIGDTVPEEIWNMPLQVVNHPEGKETITLNEYRDKKLIILDFWATWCGSCLASMPYMHELQTEMGEQAKVLPITFQDNKTILDFLNKSISPTITAIKSSFSSIVDGKVLDAYFPSKSIPHVVVLDAKGIVRAISVPSALNVENLEEMIADGNAQPVRQRVNTIDSPLLSDVAGTNGIYYSAFLAYNAAMPFTASFRTDSAKGHAHYYSLNTRLIKLFGQTVFVGDENVKHTGIHLLPSRRILEVAEPALYDQNNNEYPLEKVIFTYESIMPFKTTITEAKRKMKNDLEFQFALQAGLEKIKVPCLVLTVSDTSRLPYAKEGSQRKLVRRGVTVLNEGYEVLDHPIRTRSSSYMQNYPIKQLVYMLNKLGDGKTPFVIDETGVYKNLDLDIVDELSDFDKLEEVLLLQGIKIEKEERELMMFVLKDPNYQRPSAELALTPSGYVYRNQEEVGL